MYFEEFEAIKLKSKYFGFFPILFIKFSKLTE